MPVEITLKTEERILVDDEVAARMAGKSWRSVNGHAVYHAYRDKEKGKTARLTLVHLVCGSDAPKGYVWKHLNGDALDYRRENLELVPNGHHSHAFAGMADLERRGRSIGLSRKRFVGIYAYGEKFRAKIKVSGKQKHLGTFATEEEAARAYDDALVELGYSAVNFPDGNAPSRPLSFDERLDEIRIRGDRGGLKALLREKLTQRQKQAALHLAAEWL